MKDEGCDHRQYNGPERRVGYCDQHFGEQLQSKSNCSNIEMLEKEIDRKMPMWILLPMAGILISILSVQWATYTKMNEFTLCMERRLAVLEERQSVVRETLKRWPGGGQ